MTAPVKIETCRACNTSFPARDGEPLTMLVARYTAWRETHRECVAPVEPVAAPEPAPLPRRLGIAARFRRRVREARAGEPSSARVPRRPRVLGED